MSLTRAIRAVNAIKAIIRANRSTITVKDVADRIFKA
jgi:hypothetical protein